MAATMRARLASARRRRPSVGGGVGLAAIAFAIEPKSRQDEEKISVALHKILEEDPALHFDRDAQTKEFVLSGSGQLHVETVIDKLKKRYGVEVALHPPKVPYKETITQRAEVQS